MGHNMMSIMWLSGEDQETWLGYDGSGYKHEGQARGLGATGGEARVESLALINLGNSEEQAMLRLKHQ
jgi:hypothetical protein